jgi:hypothetical protein
MIFIVSFYIWNWENLNETNITSRNWRDNKNLSRHSPPGVVQRLSPVSCQSLITSKSISSWLSGLIKTDPFTIHIRNVNNRKIVSLTQQTVCIQTLMSPYLTVLSSAEMWSVIYPCRKRSIYWPYTMCYDHWNSHITVCLISIRILKRHSILNWNGELRGLKNH